jgi:hypothetical protein
MKEIKHNSTELLPNSPLNKALYKDQWRALVNTVIYLQVHKE